MLSQRSYKEFLDNVEQMYRQSKSRYISDFLIEVNSSIESMVVVRLRVVRYRKIMKFDYAILLKLILKE